MLEGLAAWILNTYVGEYLENLNTDQLSIGLLQGEVELENLPLRKDALKGLDLPVEVHAGYVGKIKLQIPVSRLRSEPWVIFIEKLFLIAGPVLSSEYDEKAEEETALSRKLARLEVLEAKSKGVQESKQGESYYTNWMSYGTSLMANVVENVQLKIKDVHVRYEDEESADHKFACGIVIHSLSAQSTDQNWLPKFVRKDSSDFMWKLLQLQGLSCYWDTKTDFLSHLDQKNMMAAMAKYVETCISPGNCTRSHEFILAPVNAEAHLTRNCSVKPLRSRFSPRIMCDIHLQKIPLSLSEVQYKQIMGCVKYFEVLDIRWRHRKWRPKVPVKNNAKEWWQYAICVHLEPIRKRNAVCKWTFATERACDIVKYTKVYQEYLSKLDLLPPDSKVLKESLEKKLSFELLCLLREIVSKKIQRENSIEMSSEHSKGKGFLQWMFPSWGGWYSDTSKTENVEAVVETTPDTVDSVSNVEELKSQLEEEILDVLDSADNDSLLKRDTVFAQLNFSLSQGSFILLQNDTKNLSSDKSKSEKEKPIIELEFSDVSTKVETRPRTGSFLFEIKLGALYLHDRIFAETHFPLIIAPQNRDVSFLYSKASGMTIFPLPSFLNQKSETAESDAHLFELSYEKKPFTVYADHKLNITTRALDVVYNPQVLKLVTEFFYLYHDNSSCDFSVSELKLTAAARARYEVLKQQTKQELQHKWDQILDGEDKTIYSKGWNIEMNISAPQIIIPEDIFDKNCSVVVFDLGKLHFYNARKIDEEQTSSISEDLDDDEDFITPCSTPQELQEWTERHNKLVEMMSNPNNPQQLKEQLYEKYILELSNIQVLVSRLKDNWKFAQLRGTSTMHILDRFSITIQTERRMVYTQDPDWPSVALTGNLPKLHVHVSEQKVNALQTCVDLLRAPITSPAAQLPPREDSIEFSGNLGGRSSREEKQIISRQISDGQTENNENSLLLLMEFCIDQMSFDVQSRGHSVAELQVTGVKTTFSKHPHNMSLTLCVHSLLLVDALQTFGPDFELLLASHKHLSMDSTSGSLRDSEPNSPTSPASPPSPPISSPQMHAIGPTPPAVLSAALSTLKAEPTRRWSSSLRVPKSEHYTSDALIIIEFNLVESPSVDTGCTEVLQIANVQFNSLDVIANQETIVELVEFVKRIAIQRSKKTLNERFSPVEELNKSVTEKEVTSSKYISRTEITFDFHRLNILLLRAVSQKQNTVGQKVATATVTGARIQATIGDIIEIQGSLGGLQVLDLITENTKHQKIVSIGYDPLMDQTVDWLSRLQEEMYKPITHSATLETNYALTFNIIRGDKNLSFPNESCNKTDENGYLNINVRMASLCYTHSPRLLHELSSCATEFKMYMRTLANSIKSAATEMAMGIVSKRTGSISASLHGNQFDMPTRSRLDSIDEFSSCVFNTDDSIDVSVDMKLDILLQTPVVAIPASPQSSEVLVAHLGRIAIQNGATGLFDPFSFDVEDFNEGTILLVEVRDMNMHFVNLDKISSKSSSSLDSNVKPLSVKEMYACNDKNQLIIHDTLIEVLAKTSSAVDSVNFQLEDDFHKTKSINVQGRVVNPLKVVFTKQQFQQMLRVLDNLTYVEDTVFPESPRKSLTHISSNNQTISSTNSPDISHDVLQGLQNSIRVSFELPELIAELRGDLMNREEGIVSLTAQEFVIEYKMEQMFEATLNVTLQTLLMEDLQNFSAPRCYLLSSVSNSKPQNTSSPPKSEYISASCPSLSSEYSGIYCSSTMSLPDKLSTQNMFSLQSSTRKLSGGSTYHRSKSYNEDSYPSTPPPSPTVSKSLQSHHSHNALVFINVVLVDKRSPLLNQKYHNTNRFIDIDFNCLDIILNLQTWVMVLDFFSVDSEDMDVDMTKSTSSVKTSNVVAKTTETEIKSEATNSEINLKVKSLTVVLNKPEYKLASANISNFTSDMSLRDNAYTIKGALGSISLSDLSPHGYLYPEKFVTTGSEALHYHIFKYSQQASDVQTDYDLSVKCQMSSVQYVHTQRFLTEITTFFRHFNEMQDLLRRIRLAAPGVSVSTEATRGSRILLDISAGSPVIVIPQSSQSKDVLVADLGKIAVRNTFLTAGSNGTISFSKRFVDTHSANQKEFEFNANLIEDKSSNMDKEQSEISEFLSNEYQCLLDVINVELTDMDLYSAIRVNHNPKHKSKKQKTYMSLEKILLFPSFLIKKQGNDLLQQKFMLQVQVERNLDSAISHIVPDWAIEGIVSSVYVTLDKEQYSLILGILNQNLGEPLEEFTFDPGNESEQFILMDTEEKAWTTMAIHMDLVNVTLELLWNDGIVNVPSECSLAKFDFIRSRLCYESFSDNSKDIDLVSNMVQVSDIRYKDAPVNNRPNVFTNVLQPIKKKENGGSTLQAEVHYRITNDFSRFTVLLNNMRIMGVFDFLQSVLNFLTVPNKPTDDNKIIESPHKIATSKPQDKAKTSNFEMKINVTDTELVVVEDTSLWDSNAVILKTTAVVTWKPDFANKPLSCSLQSLEVFSCILGAEDDTALSIIDPLTVSLEIIRKANSPIIRLESADVQHILEISAVHLNLRLSYYDMTMFSKIFESIKRQIAYQPRESPSNEVACNSSSVDCLITLGFARDDCEKALFECKGNVNDAALWLTQNAIAKPESENSDMVVADDKVAKKVNLTSAEIRVTSCSLCIIDDCRDADIPVIELNLSEIIFVHKFLVCPEGSGNFSFSADYYNRALSGWEPVIEPWRCCIDWKKPVLSRPGKKLSCSVTSSDAININITSSLLELCKTVKKNWTEDYFHTNTRNKDSTDSDSHSPACYRRRLPFMPFALKNNTGCKLWFSTQITSADQQSVSLENEVDQNKFSLNWTEVPPGNLMPVPFESRSKIRHKDSHSMKLHQIIVKVDGWLPVAPVSVDRVGTYFRHAQPQKTHSASIYSERPAARIVFGVTLAGSAQKLITVESALVIENKLEDTIELKLENSGMQYGVRSLSLYLVPNEPLSVPMQFVHAQIWARPVDKHFAFCHHSIIWHHVTEPEDIKGNTKVCSSIQKTSEFYRFLVLVRRRKFPTDKESSSSLPAVVQPAHKLYILPCLEIVNLLPYELHYSVNNCYNNGYIRPGKGKPLHNIDVSENFSMKFFLENFKRCKDVALSASSRHYPSRIELCDSQDRLLELQLKVLYVSGGALKLFVTAPYWLVNKTGLPLIFKQEGTNNESAGQLEEHELARCMAPLLFSFADREASTMCNMRVGKSCHLDGVPQWCHRFDMEKGIRVRRLHVMRKDGRPDWVYNIGIDVRVGRGRYCDTYVVTLTPRYQLDNRTSHKLEFCQLFATKENCQYLLSSMPKSSLPFHWPRFDLDNLLCVRQPDIKDCNWSGGFIIDNVNSFHINMRDCQGKSHFLRVEIILQSATFFIVFTDADRLPPPFRIDNRSEVPITYYQTNIDQERLKTSIRPHSSVPYAFDEPTLPPYITCCAPGGSAATYNMNIFREGNQLFYENFIYIAFAGTFDGPHTNNQSPNLSGKEYVLDVPYGNKVVINKREAGKRSQLWRMTSTGMLQHEGSSPPRDPHKPNSVNLSKMFVLDIAALSPQPGDYAPLTIKKPDPRRQHTQTWKFTSDGRLCCGYPNMYVQSKDGFKGLRRGNEVVLGPSMPVSFVTMENGIPLEQSIFRKKLRGGSGVLTVKVIPDGPTRVLSITDIKGQQMVTRTTPASEWVVVEETSRNGEKSTLSNESPQSPTSANDTQLEVLIKLTAGLGISVVNHLSEELIYAWLHNIVIEYSKSVDSHSLTGSIKDIQVDNQLLEVEKTVLLFVTQSSKTDELRHLPALQLNVIRVSTPVINAEIFKHLIVTLKNLTIMLEEQLLLKLLQFAGLDQTDNEVERADESENNQRHRSITETMAYEKRYYFSTLKLCLQQIRLSVLTSSNLPSDLVQVKRNMRLRLIRFEDATIELNTFIRIHPFETAGFLLDSVVDHYKLELKSQAAKILGAVDFLGNPIGLFNDVSDGLSKLIHERNVASVGGLIKNVTHGVSDSAAKLSASLSDGIGIVAMDDKHQKKRKEIRQQSAVAGNDHLIAGLRGLGFGLVGGMTSVFTQTYDGLVQEGVPGFFSGLGKGLVGVVAKPAVGILDFASGAASAVRDTSKGSSYANISRTRPPRTCVGPGGLLPKYSHQQAIGQDFLYNLNNRNYIELFIAKEQIRSGTEDLHALISSEQVYFLSSGSPSSSNIVLTVPFSDLYKCCYVCSGLGVIGEVRHYLQLIMKADNSVGSITVPNDPMNRRNSRNSLEPLCKKPQVRCDSEEVAKKVVLQINYAKSLHEERTYMVINDENSDDERE